MRKLERILGLGATNCLVMLALAACGSEDTGSEGYNTNTTSPTAGTTTSGTTNTVGTTGDPSTTATTGVTNTTGGVGVTSTTGTPTTTGTTGTTGTAVTTGTTGFGMTTTTTSTGAGGAAGVTATITGSGTTGVGGGTSTTGGEDEVFCDTSLTGEEYFKRPQGCASCHGIDALGTDDGGPEVRHPNADYLRWIVREGRMDHPDFPDGMPAMPEDCLTDQQIEELIVFLDSFPQPTTGAELYADYCANCHGADGRGGVTEKSLDGELHENATIVAAGRNTTNYATRGAYMTPQGDHLSAQEIQMITDYLQNDLGLRF